MSSAADKKLATELEARELAESSREESWEHRSFAKGLFAGKLDLGLIDPLPATDPDEQARAAEFLARLEKYAAEHVDGDLHDTQGYVPEHVLDGLRELGAFGIKIPREYGGLGLSQLSYGRALQIVTSRCGATGAFLSAHQSIGVPTPLVLFGTKEQKEKYLPRLARGALSAFALTEMDAGSDPANMETEAVPTEDGEAFILNGEKLWCTNGPRAELMVVMARTPAREGVRGRRPVTAFIVEREWEGISVDHVSSFMGLRGISNGVLSFRNVRVPKENILWGEGRGLKLALVTLNVGRLSLPAMCSVSGKLGLEVARKWGNERFQWGQPVGKHDAIAQKIGRLAANAFAMHASCEVAALMADAKTFDIRLEAAIEKMWHSEVAWETMNDVVQIRAGRGYETARSLAARGEHPWPVERSLRDLRINLIFEGSSEIMRLFIAREAVDDHLQIAGDLVNPRAPMGKRLIAAIRAGLHYAWWYPTRWLGWGRWPAYSGYGKLARHMRFVDRASRRLARTLFYCIVRFGPGLEKRQAVLGRLVDVGSELFIMTATMVRAKHLLKEGPSDRTPEELADLFCQHARRRVNDAFRSVFSNDDVATYTTARRALDGSYEWLEGRFVVGVDEGIQPPAVRRQLAPDGSGRPVPVEAPDAGSDPGTAADPERAGAEPAGTAGD
jgi:alkylation response protein AidB-like acyl-CoA dehydrogenase